MSSMKIHPSAFIGAGVELGNNVSIGPNAVLLGPTTVEDDVWIGAGTVIGAPPEITSSRQNTAWDGELDHFGVRIGAGSVIRELVVIHQGSHRVTTIGRESWLLNRTYVAHDVILEEKVTLSAGVSIGGHCRIGDHVNFGLNASIHQNKVVGAGAMIGMGTPVTRDVPPFAKVYGIPPRLQGLNSIGMARGGIDEATITALESAYLQGVLVPNVTENLAAISSELTWWREASPERIITAA